MLPVTKKYYKETIFSRLTAAQADTVRLAERFKEAEDAFADTTTDSWPKLCRFYRAHGENYTHQHELKDMRALVAYVRFAGRAEWGPDAILTWPKLDLDDRDVLAYTARLGRMSPAHESQLKAVDLLKTRVDWRDIESINDSHKSAV